MKFPDDDKNSQLETAIKEYKNTKAKLNQLMEINAPTDSIKITLTDLAKKLAAIYLHSNESWRNSNADFYENERVLLQKTLDNMSEGLAILGGLIIPPSVSKPPSVITLEPPPIDSIVIVDLPKPTEQAGRVVLGIFGAVLLISGIGSLAMAGFKLLGVQTAVEAAKAAGNLAAKKAAEELAKRLLVESTIYSTVGVSTIFSSSQAITMAKKKNLEVKTVPESPVLTPQSELLSEEVTPPPPPLTQSVPDEIKSHQTPHLPQALQAEIIGFNPRMLKPPKPKPQPPNLLKDLKDKLDQNRRFIEGDSSRRRLSHP